MAQNVGLGMRSHFGFGDESTWGTPVARTNFIEFISESISKQVARIESNSVLRRGVLNDHVIAGMISVSGDVIFDATYGGWLKLAKHAFGSVVTSQPDVTNAPTAYQHVFTISDTPLAGMTMEVFRDSSQFVTEPNKAFVYRGMKVSSIEFSCGVDEILRVTASLIGTDETRATKSTPSYGTSKVAAYHQGVVKWNGTDMEVDKFTLKIDNGFGPRPKLGSQYSREPVPENKLQVSGSFEMEFADWQEYDDFSETTQRAFLVTFTGDLLGGSIYEMIQLSCPVSLLDNVKVLVDKPGRIKLAVDFKAYRTTLTNECTMTVRNTDSSI